MAHDLGGWECLRQKEALVTTFSKMLRSCSTRLSPVCKRLISSRSALHGIWRYLELLKREAVGAGHVGLLGPGGYLAHAFSFRSWCVLLVGQQQVVQECFVGHEQWMVSPRTGCFHSTTSLLLGSLKK